VARLGLDHLARRLGADLALHTTNGLELKGRHHVDSDGADPHPPARPHRIPRQPPAKGHILQGVLDPIAMTAADRPRRVTDADSRVGSHACQLDVVRCADRRCRDLGVRRQPRHVAKDAMAPQDAEVVVDHLHDAGAAVADELGAGPQAGDPLAVPHRRASRRRAAHHQPDDDQQRQVHPSARLHPHPCHATHHVPGGKGQPNSHSPDRSTPSQQEIDLAVGACSAGPAAREIAPPAKSPHEDSLTGSERSRE
jgi:hypothetical protein